MAARRATASLCSLSSASALLPTRAARLSRRWQSGKAAAADVDNAGAAEDGRQAASRLDSLIALSAKLAAETPAGLPARFRGVGTWTDIVGRRHEPAHPEEREAKRARIELPKRRKFGASFVSYALPLEDDRELHDSYVGGMTSLRIGRLMEDLDTLAGSVAYRYVLPEDAPVGAAQDAGFHIVTAAVDRLDLLRPIDAKEPENMLLTGFVSYASRSSMEVMIQLASVSKRRGRSASNPDPVLIGRFTMVARSSSGGAFAVPQLELETDDQRALFELGRLQKERKKALAATSLEKEPPTREEARLVQRIFSQKPWFTPGVAPPPDLVWVADSALQSCTLVHPSERNRHGKAFGGYIMRLAYEQAFSTACLFAQGLVQFVSLDDLSFVKPVEIGSLLRLDSSIAFAPIEKGHRSFSVSVKASTVNLQTGERQSTNTFDFTFMTSKPALERYVVPSTYLETLDWLDALRKRQMGLQLRKELVAKGHARSS